MIKKVLSILWVFQYQTAWKERKKNKQGFRCNHYYKAFIQW